MLATTTHLNQVENAEFALATVDYKHEIQRGVVAVYNADVIIFLRRTDK